MEREGEREREREEDRLDANKLPPVSLSVALDHHT
jgi:hypothetical protein